MPLSSGLKICWRYEIFAILRRITIDQNSELTMKKALSIFTILFASLFACQVSAQQDSLLQKRKEKLITQAQKNSERLALTPEQKIPFSEISQKYTKKTLELKQSTLSREEKLEAVKKINSDKDAEVQLLLTPEQFKTYKEIVDERRQKMEAARNKEIKIN